MSANAPRIAKLKEKLLDAARGFLDSVQMPATEENFFLALSHYMQDYGLTITSEVARSLTPDQFAERCAAEHLVELEKHFGL